MKLHESGEDYLEAIFVLQQKKGMVGTYIPMYFMVEDSWASFAASFGEEYADRVMAVMPMWSIVLVIVGIFVFAILGGLLGKALLKKHFVKAGIV